MGLQEDFNLAAEEAKQLPAKPSNDDMLKLYALFKQANEGDCNTSAMQAQSGLMWTSFDGHCNVMLAK